MLAHSLSNPMIACSHESAGFESPQWKAVRLGLSLANSYFGASALVAIYVLWLVIALILCLVLIPFAIWGKVDMLKDAVNPFALYGFVWPVALTLATTWGVKLFSRTLWCRIPQPLTARFLALASVAGRLSVLVAVGWIWHAGGPFSKKLLLPQVIAASGIAWLGLVAEWGFIRVLTHHFHPPTDPSDPVLSSRGLDEVVESTTEAEGATNPHKGGFLTRDLGEWFKGRFPKMHKFASWILLPLAYVAASSLADDGNVQAIPNAILRLAVIAPALLQVFWIPGSQLDRLIPAFSQKAAREHFHSA